MSPWAVITDLYGTCIALHTAAYKNKSATPNSAPCPPEQHFSSLDKAGHYAWPWILGTIAFWVFNLPLLILFGSVGACLIAALAYPLERYGQVPIEARTIRALRLWQDKLLLCRRHGPLIEMPRGVAKDRQGEDQAQKGRDQRQQHRDRNDRRPAEHDHRAFRDNAKGREHC